MPVSFRYRAVASWSRVQGIGIPMITAIEIFSIWLLSFVLAIPEAIGFAVVPFRYKDENYVTCMLNPTNNFMLVSSVLTSLFGIHNIQVRQLQYWIITYFIYPLKCKMYSNVYWCKNDPSFTVSCLFFQPEILNGTLQHFHFFTTGLLITEICNLGLLKVQSQDVSG